MPLSINTTTPTTATATTTTDSNNFMGLLQEMHEKILLLENSPPQYRDYRTSRGGQRRGRGRYTNGPIRTPINRIDTDERNVFTSEGRPICNYCKKVGHIARECYSKPGNET